MSKYSYLLKKWWFLILLLLIILSLFNGIWILLFLATLTTLIFSIVKVVKNENRRKYTLIIIVAAVLLLTFSIIRTVQLYNYIADNPEENVKIDDSKKDAKEDIQTEKTEEADETEGMDQADTTSSYTVTSEDIESFNESINRLISESNGILIKVVPFENEYDMLIAYVTQDLKYQDETIKQKNADYLGSEIQQRALGTLFRGDNNQRPMVEIRYEDNIKMAGSSAFNKTQMKLTDK